MKKIIFAIILIIILGGTFYFFVLRGNKTAEPTVTTNSSDQNAATSSSQVSDTVSTITYGTSGFSPSTMTIKSGSSITWVNSSDEDLEIGVDPHPSHTGDRSLSGNQFVLTLSPGEKKTVTISTIGTLGYHNHLNSSETGTIVSE